MGIKTLLIEESEFIDFQLYGIATAFSDSPQFIYNVNLSFHTRFERIKDLDVLIEHQMAYYPIYEWEDSSTQIYYHIVKNSAYTLDAVQSLSNLSSLFDVTPTLIPQFKEYNYFLRISQEDHNEIPLQENSFIQKITPLEVAKIKSISRLIF
ncbi:IPExxxVDY family protein [Moheibacter sediminis]|uniref:IPExxxVDY family protein n=1 Tax=Moheibacter sediminis TaxID=1434700 RepID=A0A1W1YLA5_9FLAO|nr:IPExxxVDY family protein [Moheibacter sediminis]SMC36975.1 hypothetical protein SAMN06296427_101522 [Moheibacter sediminis]